LPPARRAGFATFLSESLRLAKERGSNTTLDDEFGRGLETVVSSHRAALTPACVGLILDSSVAIAAERRGDTVQAFLQRVIATAGDQEAALSPVGVVELVHGIHRADTAERRAAVKPSSRSFFPPSRSIR
jgi:hypothetical protein